jgi:hypothetical protein
MTSPFTDELLTFKTWVGGGVFLFTDPSCLCIRTAANKMANNPEIRTSARMKARFEPNMASTSEAKKELMRAHNKMAITATGPVDLIAIFHMLLSI